MGAAVCTSWWWVSTTVARLALQHDRSLGQFDVRHALFKYLVAMLFTIRFKERVRARPYGEIADVVAL